VNLSDRRRALEHAVQSDADAARRAAELLSALRHDLGNLLGTVMMETHLLGHAVAALGRALERGDGDEARRQLAEATEIRANLAEASGRARALLDGLADRDGGADEVPNVPNSAKRD
jgi:hypothetical protein